MCEQSAMNCERPTALGGIFHAWLALNQRRQLRRVRMGQALVILAAPTDRESNDRQVNGRQANDRLSSTDLHKPDIQN